MKRYSLPVAALIATLGLAAGSEPYEPKAGDAFPDLSLPSLEDGSPLSVTSFRGQKLVLHIFASW